MKQLLVKRHNEINQSIADKKNEFSTKLMLRGVHLKQTRKLEDMFTNLLEENDRELREWKGKIELETISKLKHIVNMALTDANIGSETLKYFKKECFGINRLE